MFDAGYDASACEAGQTSSGGDTEFGHHRKQGEGHWRILFNPPDQFQAALPPTEHANALVTGKGRWRRIETVIGTQTAKGHLFQPVAHIQPQTGGVPGRAEIDRDRPQPVGNLRIPRQGGSGSTMWVYPSPACSDVTGSSSVTLPSITSTSEAATPLARTLTVWPSRCDRPAHSAVGGVSLVPTKPASTHKSKSKTSIKTPPARSTRTNICSPTATTLRKEPCVSSQLHAVTSSSR